MQATGTNDAPGSDTAWLTSCVTPYHGVPRTLGPVAGYPDGVEITRAKVRTYLADLRDTGSIPGATEHTLREPLVRFLTGAAKDLGFGAITIHGELRLAQIGQPDLQVVNSQGTPIGYGETKVPGTGAEFGRVLDGEQVSRYRKSLDDLLVTDFLRFALFRADVGRLEVTLLESKALLLAGSHAVSQPVLIQLSQLLSAFFSARAPSATSAEQLADGLARRATLMRDAIRTLLDPGIEDGDSLRRLWEFYRRSLMSDMDADDFADTYAQTLTYSLFLARIEGGPIRELDAAWRAIPEDVPILRSAIEPLRGAGRLPDALSIWLTDSLHLLASTPDSVIAGIGHPSAGMPDPVLYFYEHFLAAYDRVERIRKGVFYTPRPLVDYVVRAVHDTLKTEFGRPLGLADKEVRLLDPALGTGTFLLAAAQTAVDEVATTLGQGAVRTVLEDQVLRHFFGFELLPAPYTITHLKMSLFARDKHVRFLDKRAQVFLTNTLGDPVARADDGGLLAFFVPGLIDEAAAAQRVKSDEKILVILGNPPWSATSHNKQPEIERLYAAWKTIDGRAGSPLIEDARIALNDDYLKFLRWAVWKVVEQPGGARQGIVAFVTNHGFVNGRIHRGIRKALLDAFDDIWVFDLQGNQRLWVKGQVDEKVFPDVQQGVAITIMVRHGPEHAAPARVHHRSMRGTRKGKYEAASAATLADDAWATLLPDAPFWSFAPGSADDRYDSWPMITDLFPTSSSGVQTSHDDLTVDVTAESLAAKIRAVDDRHNADDELRERFGIKENARWNWAGQRARFGGYDGSRVIPWLYRIFDRRYVYFDPVFVQWPRRALTRNLLPRPIGLGGEHRLCLIVQRARPITTIATVTRGIAPSDVTGYYGYIYPLHIADDVPETDNLALALDSTEWRENVDPALMAQLAAAYGRRVPVEDLAWYTFGVLSAPDYRVRFGPSLAIEHPRIPFPVSVDLFDRMRAFAEELGQAHLLEAPVPQEIRFEGEGTGVVGGPLFDPSTHEVWINETQRFAGVPADAWAWGGSFRPLEHFLTDRRDRQLDLDQIAMYRAAIWAVRESIRLGPGLDSALEAILSSTLELGPTIDPANPFG